MTLSKKERGTVALGLTGALLSLAIYVGFLALIVYVIASVIHAVWS